MDHRLAQPAELGAVTDLIARSFASEPFMTWVAAGDPARLRRFARLAVEHVADEILVADDLGAAALVVRPGGLEAGAAEQLRMLPGLVRSAGLRRLPAVLRGLLHLERAHPAGAHATLIALGVEPARQGAGLGGALLTAVERLRADVPIYLETGSESTRDACRRHGYDVLGELRLPGGGPRMWTMISCPLANPRTVPVAHAVASR
jgi:GNAT superfamily N-acetyltransferase